MSSTNPYQPPADIADSTTSLSDHIRITNLNHAGVPLAISFVVGPLLLAGTIWLAVHGRILGNQGAADKSAAIFLIFLLAVAELVACVYLCRVPVLWIEIGPTLRYATLLAVHEFSWGDVQRIWIDREDWEGHIAPLVSVTLVKHFVLVIQINDYKDLRVLVPTGSKYLIERIMEKHPRFKQSPFDEEPMPYDVEEDDE